MSPAHCDGELTTCPGCACEQSVLPRDLSGPKEEGQSVLLQGEQPQLLLISGPPRPPDPPLDSPPLPGLPCLPAGSSAEQVSWPWLARAELAVSHSG